MSAAVAGVWCGIGLVVSDLLDAKHHTHMFGLLWSLVFFFVPVFLFVMGIDYMRRWRISVRHPYRKRPRGRQYWTETREGWSRAVCWFLAAATSALLTDYLLRGRGL